MRISIKQSVVSIAEATVTFLLLYVLVYTQKFGTIKFFLQVWTLLCILIVAFSYTKKPFQFKRIIPKELYFWWFLLCVYSIVVGLFVAKDKEYLFSQVFTFFSFLIVCVLCVIISEEKKSYKWLLKIFVIVALLCAFFTLFNGYIGINEGESYMSMSAYNNPNDLGITMIVGIFGVIMLANDTKHKYLCVIAILLFLYIIVLSSSRKSLIIGVVIVVTWLLYAQRDSISSMSFSKKVGYLSFITVLIAIGVVVIPKIYITSGSYGRMLLLVQNGFSEGNRDKLFLDSFKLFTQHPLFGIGYKQYEVWSSKGLYSHSTYGEALACLGIFGSILFFFPLLRSFLFYIKKIINNKMTYEDKGLFIILVAILILGISVIINYDLLILLILSIVFMKQNDYRYEL